MFEKLFGGFAVLKKTRRNINVGIDFGTSYTKVSYRDHAERKSFLMQYGKPNGLLPSFYIPSSVRVHDGRIYFAGEFPKESQTGDTYTSFKICIPCSRGHRGICRLKKNGDSKACFTVKDQGSEIQINPVDLSSLYLAFVIGLVRKRLEIRYGARTELKLTYNMCAPLPYFEQGEALSEFERALFFGERLAPEITNGMKVKTALEKLSAIRARIRELPQESERTTHIVPETLAAIYAFVNSRTAEEGLYGIVDIGSGTTDVSFFRYARKPSHRVAFYYDAVDEIGVDEISRAIASRAGTDEASLEHIRISLMKNSVGDKPAKDILVDTGEKIFRHYQATWRKAYKKEKSSDRWATFGLFSIGGGSRIDELHTQFKEPPWQQIRAVSQKRMRLEEEFPLDADKSMAVGSQDSDLSTVAYGLSFHKPELPEFSFPGEVGEFKPWFMVRSVEDADSSR